MRLRSTRTIAAAVTGLALLAGGATALAASGSGSGSGSPGSSSSGSSSSGMRLTGPGAAVTHGLVMAAPLGECGVKVKAPFIDPIKAAAGYLGLSIDELRQQLESGKSLADVATAEGKSVDGLKQAILDAARSALDESVAAGDLTSDDEQQILVQLRAQLDDIVNGTNGFAIKIHGAPGGPMLDGPFATAASYLGLTVDQMTTELQAGKSLAEIATEHGKSADGLEQALFDAAKADLQKAIHELVNAKGLPGPACEVKLGEGAVVPAPGFGPPGTP
jgi:hypothetical protein